MVTMPAMHADCVHKHLILPSDLFLCVCGGKSRACTFIIFDTHAGKWQVRYCAAMRKRQTTGEYLHGVQSGSQNSEG